MTTIAEQMDINKEPSPVKDSSVAILGTIVMLGVPLLAYLGSKLQSRPPQ